MMLPETATRIQKFLDNYEAHADWDTLRTERANDIVPMVLQHVAGDILEIGAFQGRSTSIFCKVGAEYDRVVHVVDPWDGRQQGNHGAYNKFKENTAAHANLTVQKLGSEDPRVLAKFKEDGTKFAFILIDGYHTYNNVRSDLISFKDLLQPRGVICLDDWHGPYAFSNAIQQAANDYLDDNYLLLKAPDSFIERYFVKLS